MKKTRKTTTLLAVFATAAIALTVYYGCKKPNLDGMEEQNAFSAHHINNQGDVDAEIDTLGFTLDDYLTSPGGISADSFATAFGKRLYILYTHSAIDVWASDFPNDLVTLEDDLLIAIITSTNLNDAEKVTALLLQEELSTDVVDEADMEGLDQHENATDVPYETGTVSESGITVSSGMLEFASMLNLDTVMNSMVNHHMDDVDDWESSLGFKSLRSVYDSLYAADATVDDYIQDSLRAPDEYFESILNRYRKVKVADTTYEYASDYSYVDLFYPGAFRREYLDGPASSCPFIPTKRTEAKKNLTGSTRVLGEKWNKNFFIFASVGARSTYYELKSGKWKREDAILVQVFIDQWHKVCTEGMDPFNGCTPNNCISNEKRAAILSSRVKAVYWSGVNQGRRCVCEYGRLHHYTTNFYNDVHTENW